MCAHVPPQSGKSEYYHILDGKGEKQLPADIHEMIIKEAWQRSAHTDIDKKKHENLGEQPERPLDEFIDLRKIEEGRARGGEGQADGRQNEPAKDCFVAKAVPNDPQAEGDQKHRRKIVGKRPS